MELLGIRRRMTARFSLNEKAEALELPINHFREAAGSPSDRRKLYGNVLVELRVQFFQNVSVQTFALAAGLGHDLAVHFGRYAQ